MLAKGGYSLSVTTVHTEEGTKAEKHRGLPTNNRSNNRATQKCTTNQESMELNNRKQLTTKKTR